MLQYIQPNTASAIVFDSPMDQLSPGTIMATPDNSILTVNSGELAWTPQAGAPGGPVLLDGTGTVPYGLLPSYIDDVIEYPTEGDFPVTGAQGILYMDESNGSVFRWTGSQYVQTGGQQLEIMQANASSYLRAPAMHSSAYNGHDLASSAGLRISETGTVSLHDSAGTEYVRVSGSEVNIYKTMKFNSVGMGGITGLGIEGAVFSPRYSGESGTAGIYFTRPAGDPVISFKNDISQVLMTVDTNGVDIVTLRASVIQSTSLIPAITVTDTKTTMSLPVDFNDQDIASAKLIQCHGTKGPTLGLSASARWVQLGTFTIPDTNPYSIKINICGFKGYNNIHSQMTDVNLILMTCSDHLDSNGFCGVAQLAFQSLSDQDIGAKIVSNAAGYAARNYTIYLDIESYSNFTYKVESIIDGATWAASGAISSDPGVPSSTITEALKYGAMSRGGYADDKRNWLMGYLGGTVDLTDGYPYIPTTNGAPTATPTSSYARRPMCFDSINNKLYIWNTTWKSVTLS